MEILSLSYEKLEQLKNEDKSIEQLQDIDSVIYNYSNTLEERMINLLKQMDNPFKFKNGEIKVEMNFLKDNESTVTLKEILNNCYTLNSN